MALASPLQFPKHFEHRHCIRVNPPIKRHRSFIIENIPAEAGVVITIFYTIIKQYHQDRSQVSHQDRNTMDRSWNTPKQSIIQQGIPTHGNINREHYNHI